MTHVLIVEDHEENRNLLKMLLQANGYRVTAAGDGFEALAAARRDPPDVIVSDVLMPKLDGFALCRAWMEDGQLRNIPFIFYTATNVRSEDEEFGLTLGAARYLVKPLEAKLFLQELRAVLQQASGHAAPAPRLPLDDAVFHTLHELALSRKLEDKVAQLEAANRKLQESEARFRSLTEMSSDFYWESDAGHRITLRISAGKKSNIVSPLVRGTQIGQRRWEIPTLSPDEAGWQAHRAVLDAHQPFREFELSRLGTDGMEHYVSISGDPVFDASGAFTGYRGVGNEITERVRRVEDLERLRAAMDATADAIYLVDRPSMRFIYVNDAACRMQSRTREELLTLGPDGVLATSRAELTRVYDSIIAGGAGTEPLEMLRQREDGSQVCVELVRRAQRSSEGWMIITVVRDITAHKHAEEQIQRYLAQIENAFMSTVQVITTLGEMRDPYTAGHQRRVAEIAVAIGAELSFDARRQEGLRVAGYLHDIGKIRIPSEILSKPGKLSPAEFQLVQGHAQASYDVLKDVAFPWPVAEVSLQHHERMDGSGYPQGLRGEAIALEARIIAVADVIEAMSSHRPYRAGLGIEAALSEIERGRGSAYDSVVADACLHLFRESRYQLQT